VFQPLNASGVIVIVNSVLVAIGLVVAGAWLAHGELSATSPGKRQNIGEAILSFFVGKARGIAHGDNHDRIMRIVTPLLATLFLFIIVSNLTMLIPIPIVNRPPTSHFSVTLGLALFAVGSTLMVSAALKGTGKTIKHLFWPNPLQWVSEITDVLSLSLRLFGNIAGEYMTVALVVLIVPVGIPLILHALGLIPAFVQALVFTLLTTSFLANALHDDGGSRRRPKKSDASAGVVSSTQTAEGRS
jgi:F0F1-type ATP synthase membrane subunit a